MVVPMFVGRTLYWVSLPIDEPLDDWFIDAEKQLARAKTNRDKSWGKLMNDRFITNMAEKGMWEELFLEDKKWHDSYWEVLNLEKTIDLMRQVYKPLE